MAASKHPTMHEVLKAVRPLGASGSKKNPVSIVDGKSMKPISMKEGIVTLTVEQLLWIRIPVQRVTNGDIDGYQRHLTTKKARDFARWLVSHPNYLKTLPVIEISVDGENAFYTDGQHRGAGGVIAGLPIRAVVTRRTEAEARELFALQARATKPPKNVLIFDGDGPYEEYIQDAVTDSEHPWNKLISSANSGGVGNRMSAAAALGMLRGYVARTAHQSGYPSSTEEERFNKDVADDLAVLVSAFGNRKTNPAAFSSISLRAIAETARQVFREREPHSNDRDRWIRRMATFNFNRYGHIRSSVDLADLMIKYWDTGLPEARKVKP